MALSDWLVTPQRRINPHRGLVIDVALWAEAHDYHRIQQARHGMVMHSPGIVSGLDVTASGISRSTVLVHPGAAFDAEGRLIVVPEPHQLDLSSSGVGTSHVALQYREVPDSPMSRAGDEWAHAPHTLEVFSISAGGELPEGPCLELARVRVSGSGAAISDAVDPRIPQADEIDLRYRRISGTGPSTTIGIGVASVHGPSGPEPHHLAGAMDLIQAINRTTGYRGHFAGLFNLTDDNLADDTGNCDLLLIAGREPLVLSSNSREVLLSLLARGTVLFAEYCGAAGEGEPNDMPAFREFFETLATETETSLAPIESNHPLLAACHRFSGPPRGAGETAQVMVGRGMVYSEGDYGCLWSGARPLGSVSREAIRSATEFGVNLAAFAANSVYTHSLRMRAS